MKSSKFTAILYGWLTILFFVFVSSAILTFIIRFTSITAFTLSYITLVIGLFILFIGGLMTGLKGKDMGLLLGFITGAGFSILTFLIQFLGYNELFSIQQTLFHITYILSAMAGAVVGVNILNSNEKSVS